MKNWKKIFTTPLLHQAELIRSLLFAHEIESVILNKQDSMYHWGYFEVHVIDQEEEKAIKLIENDANLS